MLQEIYNNNNNKRFYCWTKKSIHHKANFSKDILQINFNQNVENTQNMINLKIQKI